jgi:hypothetical protein
VKEWFTMRVFIENNSTVLINLTFI